MIDFKIIINLDEASQKGWNISLISENDGKLFNERGQEVQSTFEGRKYSVFKRGHKPSSLEKFGLVLLTIFTVGIALANAYVFDSLVHGMATRNFAVCVPASPKPQAQMQAQAQPQPKPQGQAQAQPQLPKEPSVDICKEEKIPEIDLEAVERSRQIDVELFSELLNGRENFEKLPLLNFNGNLHPKYPLVTIKAGLSVINTSLREEIKNINSDIIRGVTSDSNEFLIVKFKDYRDRLGISVLMRGTKMDEFLGHSMYSSEIEGVSLVTWVNGLEEVQNETKGMQKPDEKEKFKELFAKGSITGSNPNFPKSVTISLASKQR